MIRPRYLRGFASRYGQHFLRQEDGTSRTFLRGSLRSALGLAHVPFLIGHDPHRQAATTADDLTLLDDAEGLAFLLDLDRADHAETIREMIALGGDGMSLGYHVVEWWETARFGHRCQHASEVDVREISLVPSGAVEGAFAELTDNGAPLAEQIAEIRQSAWRRDLIVLRRDLAELERQYGAAALGKGLPPSSAFGDLVLPIIWHRHQIMQLEKKVGMAG